MLRYMLCRTALSRGLCTICTREDSSPSQGTGAECELGFLFVAGWRKKLIVGNILYNARLGYANFFYIIPHNILLT